MMKPVRSMPERRGLSAVEFLISSVALGLLGLLLAPAVLQSKEQARSEACTDHLRQIGQASLVFAEANSSFLPNNQISPFGSWNTQLLDGVGEAATYDAYSFSADWWDDDKSKNRQVGAIQVGTYQCPSAPHPQRQVHLRDDDGETFTMAPTDYVGSAGAYLHTNTIDKLHRGAMAYPGRRYGASNRIARRAVRASEVLDGASNTLLVVEMADKPNGWRMQKLERENLNPEMPPQLNPGISSGNWSAPNWNHLRSFNPETGEAFGPCAVNCSNGASIYGFHEGGANVAFVDGSARKLRAGLPQSILIALVSVADGEVIGKSDYLAASEGAE